MIKYTEQEDGNISTDGKSIPSDERNKDYREALELVGKGEATIEAWEGSQRQIDKGA